MRHDTPPCEETTFASPNVVVLDEGSWVLPITETNTVVIRATTEIENDTQNNQARYGYNLDGTI